MGLVSFGGTGRDDISMQFASRDFRPSWEAVKLPLASPRRFLISMYVNIFSVCFFPDICVSLLDR